MGSRLDCRSPALARHRRRSATIFLGTWNLALGPFTPPPAPRYAATADIPPAQNLQTENPESIPHRGAASSAAPAGAHARAASALARDDSCRDVRRRRCE